MVIISPSQLCLLELVRGRFSNGVSQLVMSQDYSRWPLQSSIGLPNPTKSWNSLRSHEVYGNGIEVPYLSLNHLTRIKILDRPLSSLIVFMSLR